MDWTGIVEWKGGRCLFSGVPGFSGMGSGMVERWNGGMDACVVLLVHVGNNCIGGMAEISIMGR